MRNKLKRGKNYKDTTSLGKHQVQIPGVIVLSESSCSGDETSLAAQVKYGSNCTVDFSKREAAVLQEEKKTLYPKGVKIAPIFLRTTQHRNNKERSDGEQGQPVETKQKPVLPPEKDDLQLVRSSPTVSDLTVRDRSVLSTRRRQLSPCGLYSCLEEIQTCNPAVPVQTLFSTLQKKANEGLQECGPTADHFSYQSSSLNEKRKRGNEISEGVPKRLRSAEGAAGMGHCHLSDKDVQESTARPVQQQPRSSKLSRTHRLKLQSGGQAGPVNNCELNSGWTQPTESNAPLLKNSGTLQNGCQVTCFEDVLWTDKYSPQRSSEVIGNSASVNKLHSWLTKWKLRALCNERMNMEERKQEENSNDSWDCGDFQGEAGSEDGGEEPLCNTLLITGPSGVGKTASVYACAQELGFKVFEVNCSSQRSGRYVLSQLKEVTQSHLVETSGNDPLKPAYFSNYNTNSCTMKSQTSPGATTLSKNCTSTSKRRAARHLGCSGRKVKAKPATVTLAHYFKMKAKVDDLHFGGLSTSKKPDSKKSGDSSPGSDQPKPQNKKTATSLILFEEVDVIFDDDVGFLAAIKAFMATTKRPVILTTNDPSFKERFDCSLEEITFKTPSAANVCSYLQLVCLAERVRLDPDDVSSLIRLTCGDIRRCLLQLQLWVTTGGRQASQSGCFHKEPFCVQYSNATEEGNSLDSQLPPREAGCSADMLGLHPVTPNHLLNLLRFQRWSETDMNELLKLLAESWRRGVPLLYSNLELLLSLRAEVMYSGLQSEPAPSGSVFKIQQRESNISPSLSETSNKSVRRISRLSRRKYVTAVFDKTSSSTLTPKPQKTSSFNVNPSRVFSLSDKTEQNAAKVVSDCLDALTDFFDLMSYLDATLPAAGRLGPGSETFVWTGAEFKDGLLDEKSEEEEDRNWSQEGLLYIQAAAEGLGCHRCSWRVTGAWTEAQKHRQTLEDKQWGKLVDSLALTSSSNRQSLSFSFRPLCAPNDAQRRFKLSRMVLNSRSFSLLGNREAVGVDYMPVLRSICRSHRARQLKEEPVRVVNYLNSKHLGLSKSTMQLLSEDFTWRKVWKEC
ncbi:ATPase family AAA domain-containing protein 5b [Embiotoca jacksoni]|uniref:ATPase family AAA domain-containing protein 5b n=1 Tax=Embiotoca jacksoni TaxID=100190 RepID=UPI0037044C51